MTSSINFQRHSSTYDPKQLLGLLLLATGVSSHAAPIDQSRMSLPTRLYSIGQHENTIQTVNVSSYLESCLLSEKFEIAATSFYSKLLLSQERLGAEFEKVLYQNLSDLYES